MGGLTSFLSPVALGAVLRFFLTISVLFFRGYKKKSKVAISLTSSCTAIFYFLSHMHKGKTLTLRTAQRETPSQSIVSWVIQSAKTN
ncbi:hypothetical protein BGW80DRAFT_1308686 [Lactifluus volemus]|nr:hypothetical protein BGW80DRAFT_1308686 [Lactifluus volemus]